MNVVSPCVIIRQFFLGFARKSKYAPAAEPVTVFSTPSWLNTRIEWSAAMMKKAWPETGSE